MPEILGLATVQIIEPFDHDIVFGCKVCGKILGSFKRKYMIGITIKDAGRTFKYFLGAESSLVCCGEVKNVMKTFDTDSEAEAERGRVVAYLNAHHSTEGLTLLSFSHHGMN